MTNVAFLGLGIMGTGMARNLMRAGHAVTGWNRTPRALPDDLAGMEIAGSPAAAVAGLERMVLCLTGPDAQRDVILGHDGVVEGVSTGAIVVDSTTTDPRLTQEIADALEKRGARYLDCPVFGSRNEAWEGRLDFVCGGDPAAFAAVKPLLEAMAATVHHLGPTTAGASMKLVGNLLVAAQMVSLGEALSVARKCGLDPDAVMGALDVTDFSSGLIRGVGRASLAGDFSPHFYLKHMLKDARLIEDYARSLAVSVPSTAITAELYQGAVNQGLGDLNASAVHKLFYSLAGLEPVER